MKAHARCSRPTTSKKQIEKIRSRAWTCRPAATSSSGGEGLCAIDVNTGKFTGKKSQEETVTTPTSKRPRKWPSSSAADIGGIIVIDFIDMPPCPQRQKVTEALPAYTSDDRAKIQDPAHHAPGPHRNDAGTQRESALCPVGRGMPGNARLRPGPSRESMYIRLKREIICSRTVTTAIRSSWPLNPAVAAVL